ncbi:hypothetical protein K7432_006676 [Basidiobolus ranarum]|uniref:Uncharacterized protein n=1 Tax=Basidiobolus ranarum TaxID=34480 RepID=A0ABR2WUJ9_9FUNG
MRAESSSLFQFGMGVAYIVGYPKPEPISTLKNDFANWVSNMIDRAYLVLSPDQTVVRPSKKSQNHSGRGHSRAKETIAIPYVPRKKRRSLNEVQAQLIYNIEFKWHTKKYIPDWRFDSRRAIPPSLQSIPSSRVIMLNHR